MKTYSLLFAVTYFVVATARDACAQNPGPDPGRALTEIKKLGGRFKVDEKHPLKPVVKVNLSCSKVTDAGLEHLRGLAHLQRLNLSKTAVTDAGLAHIQGLAQLQSLYLVNTKVTGPGLVHLHGMSKLEYLGLSGTAVTDEALAPLYGLTKLQTVSLAGTKVTDAGVKKFQEALPKVMIVR